MDSLTLKHLVSHLSEAEAERFRAFNLLFTQKDNSRIRQIFDLYRVVKGELLVLDTIYEEHFTDISRKAFFILQKRLAERLVEYCCLSGNATLSKDVEFSNLLELRRKILQAEYLRQKGFKYLATEWFKDIYAKSDELGYADIALEALVQVRAMSPDNPEVDTVRAQVIQRLLNAVYADILNRSVFDTFNQMSRYSLNTDPAVAYLLTEISGMLNRANQTLSPRAVFYAYYLAGIMETQQKNFSKAFFYFDYLQNWLKNSKGVGSKNRMAMLFSQMGQLFLESAHYTKAYDYFSRSLSLYPQKSKNNLTIQLSINLTLFLQADFLNLTNILSQLSKDALHPEILAIYAYQQAAIDFVQENFSAATKQLEQADTLLKDKAGWNINIRFMELLLLIEKQDFDLALYKVDTLRKHAEKYLQRDERDYMRYKLLAKIIHESGDFRNTLYKYNLVQDLLDKTPWRPNTFELIREDCWLISKVRQAKYWNVFVENLPRPVELEAN